MGIELGWNGDGMRMELGWRGDGVELGFGWNWDRIEVEWGWNWDGNWDGIGVRMGWGWNWDRIGMGLWWNVPCLDVPAVLVAVSPLLCAEVPGAMASSPRHSLPWALGRAAQG